MDLNKQKIFYIKSNFEKNRNLFKNKKNTKWNYIIKKTALILQNIKYVYNKKKIYIWFQNFAVKKILRQKKNLKSKKNYKNMPIFIRKNRRPKKKIALQKKRYSFNKNIDNKKSKWNYYQNHLLTCYYKKNFYKFFINLQSNKKNIC